MRRIGRRHEATDGANRREGEEEEEEEKQTRRSVAVKIF